MAPCQLIMIAHNIYRAFDANPSLEVRGVFLDLSKARSGIKVFFIQT